jgi:hypothetical protein
MDVAAASESAEKRPSLARAISSILNKHANGMANIYDFQHANEPLDCTKFIEGRLDAFWTMHVLNKEATTHRRVGALELWASVSNPLMCAPFLLQPVPIFAGRPSPRRPKPPV